MAGDWVDQMVVQMADYLVEKMEVRKAQTMVVQMADYLVEKKEAMKAQTRVHQMAC